MHSTQLRYLLIAAGGIVVGLLVAGTSVQRLAPFVLLLACPLMMIFMMRGVDHGQHGGHDANRPNTDRPAGQTPREHEHRS
jgi:hypothetical protein